DQGGQTCEHTTSLLRWHLDELDAKIVELQTARVELQAMYKRAGALDPAECTDANRCQIITAE
ncbi:MerR family DNA-binding protein, partial [Ilumatobacter sp.]